MSNICMRDLAKDFVKEKIDTDIDRVKDCARLFLKKNEEYVLYNRVISKNKSLRECGKDIGLSRERVRQIEFHAIINIWRYFEYASITLEQHEYLYNKKEVGGEYSIERRRKILLSKRDLVELFLEKVISMGYKDLEQFNDAMSILPERSAEVVRLRSGIDGVKRSYAKVGKVFGICRSRAREIYVKPMEIMEGYIKCGG